MLGVAEDKTTAYQTPCMSSPDAIMAGSVGSVRSSPDVCVEPDRRIEAHRLFFSALASLQDSSFAWRISVRSSRRVPFDFSKTTGKGVGAK